MTSLAVPFLLAALVQPSAVSADTFDAARERQCLTMAIYYEGAHEPEEGQDAIARVVLNRTQSPRYPGTICGVVWQGHERPTGCQFSFTCDGSLRRMPMPKLWRRAQDAADRALAAKDLGSTPDSMINALHYHADYVFPRWRHAMTEVARIGRHIFYRPGASLNRSIAAMPIIAHVRTTNPDPARTSPPSVWGLDLARLAEHGTQP